MDKLEQITNNSDLMSDLERLQWAEWERKSIEQDLINTSTQKGLSEGLKQGLEQGIEKGIEQGMEKQTIEIIKSMLKKKMSYKDINEITNKSISEIKEIEKTMIE